MSTTTPAFEDVYALIAPEQVGTADAAAGEVHDRSGSCVDHLRRERRAHRRGADEIDAVRPLASAPVDRVDAPHRAEDAAQFTSPKTGASSAHGTHREPGDRVEVADIGCLGTDVGPRMLADVVPRRPSSVLRTAQRTRSHRRREV